MSTKYKFRNGIFIMEKYETHESFPLSAPRHIHDDFEGTAVDANIWTEVEVADSTKAIALGILTYHLHGTGETEEVGIYGRDSKSWDIGKGLQMECRLAVHVAPTLEAEFMIGVQNDSYSTGSNRILNADEVAKYAAFGFYATLGVGLIPAIRTDDGTLVSGIISSGITAFALDAYHIFRIDFTNIADVKFYIDGVCVAPTTVFNMSTAASLMVQPIVMAQKLTPNTGLGDIYVDYIKLWSLR